ncbi:MAG: matrixin family metalloprotease [Bacteriovoracaceae bacterium]|nr:matrixin family metalloprotease [Bacteriovoracaceae bacterium]
MRKLLLFTITFFVALGSNAVFGYSFTEDFDKGFYWKSFPVEFDVVESNNLEEGRLEGFLSVAIQEWEDETGHDIWEQVYGGTKNVIRWTDDITGETGFSAASTLGVTIRHNVGTFFERVEIVLNRRIPELVSNRGNLLYQTILHEMGHTVGLGHTNEGGIMQASLGSFNQLYADDIEGMKAVMDESLWRQDTGYISDQAFTTVKSSGCGGVGSDAASNGAGMGYLISLAFGLLAVYLPIRVLRWKLLPLKAQHTH